MYSLRSFDILHTPLKPSQPGQWKCRHAPECPCVLPFWLPPSPRGTPVGPLCVTTNWSCLLDSSEVEASGTYSFCLSLLGRIMLNSPPILLRMSAVNSLLLLSGTSRSGNTTVCLRVYLLMDFGLCPVLGCPIPSCCEEMFQQWTSRCFSWWSNVSWIF